jgi:F1F0 ATPase subunit 2
MSEILQGILSILIGLALGGIFFGGLWWTVRQAVTSQKPGTLVVVSFVIRSLVLLIGFFAVASYGGLVQLIIALVACLSVRFIMVRKIRPPETTGESPAPEELEPVQQAEEESEEKENPEESESEPEEGGEPEEPEERK